MTYLKIALFLFILIVFVFIFQSSIRHFLHYFMASVKKKDVVYFSVLIPREDTEKDKQKKVEKDFKEKIGVMSQLYRSLHEIRELDLGNQVRVWLYNLPIMNFDIVCRHSMIEFRVSTFREYRDLLEKQITTYYPNAAIDVYKPEHITRKGYKTRSYFAFLERVNWYPIKMYKEIENDPLNVLTNVFSKMQDDEIAMVSVSLRPINAKWQNKANAFGTELFKGKDPADKSHVPKIFGFLGNLFGAIFSGYEGSDLQSEQTNAPGAKSGDSYVRMLQSNEETAKNVGIKSTQLGYETVIRLYATAKTKKRAIEILNGVFVGFNVFKDAASNWFQMRRIIPIDFINNYLMVKNYFARYFSFGEKKSIMVPDELANVLHFPDSNYNASPSIKWLKYKVVPCPPDVPQEGLYIGDNVYRGVRTKVHMLPKDRTRHFYIIGKTGAGKSNFISFLARQDAQKDRGFCVVDPHGDLVEDILNYVPKHRAKDVIVFDPSNLSRPMGLNILDAKTPQEADMVSSQATEIFIKLFGDEIFGPRIQHYFRNACLTLMEDPDEGATLIDVPRIFTDDAFMKYKVSKCKNPVVRSFWDHEYANTGQRERQEMIPYFSSKFGPFITNTVMRNTIGQLKSAFDIRDAMDTKKILLINLSKGKIGDLNTQLLGLVIVSKIQMAAMGRADMLEKDRIPFYLYVDEFQNFATDSFATILSEARKYKLCLTMAHQYINQLVTTKFGSTSSAIKDAVFGNVGSMMSFKVGAEDAKVLAEEYSPVLTEQDIINVANYKAYLKLNINNTTSRPFSIETLYDLTGKNEKLAAYLKKYSSMRFARARKFVEEEVGHRIGFDFKQAK